MKAGPPCKGCNDRRPACHGGCKKYAAWKSSFEARRRRLALAMGGFVDFAAKRR